MCSMLLMSFCFYNQAIIYKSGGCLLYLSELQIRSMKKSEEDIPVPPLVQSAALWGKFDARCSDFCYPLLPKYSLAKLMTKTPRHDMQS